MKGRGRLVVGLAAPDARLAAPAGTAVALSDLWARHRYLLLVFLRHLA